MKRFNKAFTLTELLVALGVIAVLCAVLMPIIFNSMPNQNTMMAKRTYYAAQSVVSDLINDEACYPDKTSSSEARIGFDDGYGFVNCVKWGGVENTNTLETEGSAATKFETLFTEKLSASKVSTDNYYVTADGAFWWLHDMSGFNTKNEVKKAIIVVDVNGAQKPNYGQSKWTLSDEVDCSACEDVGYSTSGSSYDRFTIIVTTDGGVKIYEDDTWAINAVSVSKDITSSK